MQKRLLIEEELHQLLPPHEAFAGHRLSPAKISSKRPPAHCYTKGAVYEKSQRLYMENSNKIRKWLELEIFICSFSFTS